MLAGMAIIALFVMISPCTAGDTRADDGAVKCAVVQVGESLERYAGTCIEVTGTVMNTKYPSLGNYWITAFELEDYRGKTVTVTGIVRKRTESTGGTFTQGRDGTYYHLEILTITPAGAPVDR